MPSIRIETNVSNEMLDKVREARELIDKLNRIMSDLRFAGITLEIKEEKTSSAATDEEK